MASEKGVIAYGSVPSGTGTMTFYLHLAPYLRSLGWQVYSVAMGQHASQLADPRFADEYSVILAPGEHRLNEQVRAFLDWIDHVKADIVIPTYEGNIIAAVPHLPANVRYVTICHNVIRSAFVVSATYRERLSCVVAQNYLEVKRLQNRWKVPPDKIKFINHGINIEPFRKIKHKNDNKALNLVFIGRINHGQKGALWLPGIMKELSDLGIPAFLHVVGQGPDLGRLRTSMARKGLGARVRFYGARPHDQIPPLLSQAQVFLMPSRFESFPLSLVEAMAAGCVPIATSLQGITDMIVEDGVNGFLCPMGKLRNFADRVALLHKDRDRLARMAEAARQQVETRFNIEQMATQYDQLFTEVILKPPIPWNPIPLEKLHYPKALLPTWRAWVPQPIKTFTRTWVNRLFGRVI